MKTMELKPNDSRKSFYGKCYVELLDDGSEVLYSYGTKIMTKKIDGTLIRHWSGWTNTTGRHIRAFCELDKKSFMELPLE